MMADRRSALRQTDEALLSEVIISRRAKVVHERVLMVLSDIDGIASPVCLFACVLLVAWLPPCLLAAVIVIIRLPPPSPFPF